MIKLLITLLILSFGTSQDLISYKITDKALKELQSYGIPEQILKGLEQLKDQPVLGEGKFLQMLKAAIGEKAAERYQSTVLRYALDPLHESIEYAEPTRFEMSAEKPTYYVGEVVGLNLTLYNERAKPIKACYLLSLMDVAVYYRKIGGDFVSYQPDWLEHEGLPILGPTVLPAYGKDERTVALFYNSRIGKLVLSEPGEYEFKARFRQLESSIVRVTVMSPPDGERAALVALTDREFLEFLGGDISMNIFPDQVESPALKAAAFLEKHPQSIYAALVERRLRWNLEEAAKKPGKLTPKLKAIKERLPEK